MSLNWTAAGFKQAAGPAKEVFPPRDAVNHASDLAKFKVRKLAAPATTNSWNGVSAPTCLPKVDWGRLIPPYLHLILGTVNDEVQAIYSELLVLDKVDSASVDRMDKLTAALADREDELIDHAEEVISLLTPSHAFESANIGLVPDLGRMVEEKPITFWSRLTMAANSSAAAMTKTALELRASKKNPKNGHTLSKRQLKRAKLMRPR